MVKLFGEFVTENLIAMPHTQYGSNDGGIHKNEATGEKFYVKHYKNPDQGKVEALTGKIYHHMGIPTVNPERHGEDGIKSKWNDDLHKETPGFYANISKQHAHELGKMYHAAILTKNWDIVGLEHDNVMHNHKTGHLHAIDHGGAFHFRAQGSHKDYGSDIGEKESLLNPSQAAGHVFGHAFKAHPYAEKAGLEAVKNIDDDHIHHLFRESGLENWRSLHKNFMSRKNKLLDSYKNS
jgi:hypothetical protein